MEDGPPAVAALGLERERAGRRHEVEVQVHLVTTTDSVHDILGVAREDLATGKWPGYDQDNVTG